MSPDIKSHFCRNLDICDLFVLKMLGENKTYAQIGEALYLTPPAICCRVKKYMQLWEGFKVEKAKTNNKVTREICNIAVKMIDTLSEYFEENRPTQEEFAA